MDMNAVTSGNMSIDSKLVATEGERGRYREITVDSGVGKSVVNPDDWPNFDLKPSKGSVKGQRHVGPGSEKISARTDSESSHRTTRSECHLEPSDVPRSQGPQASDCSVRSDRLREHCGLRWKWILHSAKFVCRCGVCERGHHRSPRTHTTACEKWSLRLTNVGT